MNGQEKAIKDQIEREARKKQKLLFLKYPPEMEKMFLQVDRIERMLKWIIIKQILNSKDGFIKRMKIPEADNKLVELVQKRRDEILDQLPDISDILEKKK